LIRDAFGQMIIADLNIIYQSIMETLTAKSIISLSLENM
jgi:hypothetical protein